MPLDLINSSEEVLCVSIICVSLLSVSEDDKREKRLLLRKPTALGPVFDPGKVTLMHGAA